MDPRKLPEGRLGRLARLASLGARAGASAVLSGDGHHAAAKHAAEVLGTGSFYEMFKFHPVGRYVVNVCTNVSCQLLGGEELLEHAESTLGVRAGGTTDDGLFTVEDVECVAACTEAPCFTVNYRYFHRADTDTFDEVVADLRAGRSPLVRGASGDGGDIPDHGTLGRVRQHVPDDRRAGVVPPEDVTGPPAWMPAAEEEAAS